MAQALTEGGRPREAISLLEKAIRLNPFFPGQYLAWLSRSHFLLRQYDTGLKVAERLLDRGQNESNANMINYGHAWCAINLVELGQTEQAQAHMTEFLKAYPRATVNYWEGYYKTKFQNPADLERVLNALHKAGMKRY